MTTTTTTIDRLTKRGTVAVEYATEWAYADLGACLRLDGGRIVHAQDKFNRHCKPVRVGVEGDRDSCEILSDGSIAHVPSAWTADRSK